MCKSGYKYLKQAICNRFSKVQIRVKFLQQAFRVATALIERKIMPLKQATLTSSKQAVKNRIGYNFPQSFKSDYHFGNHMIYEKLGVLPHLTWQELIALAICFRPSCNVFGYIDWTTGLLLSDNSSEVYPEQQQSPHQHHQSLQSPTAFALSPGIAISRPPTELPSHPKLQPQQGPVTSPSLSLPLTPIVQLTNTSTHCTPSYTLAPTTEIVINSILQHCTYFIKIAQFNRSFIQVIVKTNV